MTSSPEQTPKKITVPTIVALLSNGCKQVFPVLTVDLHRARHNINENSFNSSRVITCGQTDKHSNCNFPLRTHHNVDFGWLCVTYELPAGSRRVFGWKNLPCSTQSIKPAPISGMGVGAERSPRNVVSKFRTSNNIQKMYHCVTCMLHIEESAMVRRSVWTLYPWVWQKWFRWLIQGGSHVTSVSR
jgi:hypothetical protein